VADLDSALGGPRRIAILGIGHPLRRDDAAGVAVCDRIRRRLGRREGVLVVSGDSAPENCVGALRSFGPDRVVIVDAARMGEAPGTLLRIDPSDPRAWGGSTHTLPLPVFCRYLRETLACDVVLLGIEPADTSFGEGLGSAVQEAVRRAAEAIVGEFAPAITAPPPPRPLTPSPRRGEREVDVAWRSVQERTR
jgi:hydrogenase 3 maturation protease